MRVHVCFGAHSSPSVCKCYENVLCVPENVYVSGE